MILENLFFANPEIENAFHRAIQCEEERGGWLMCYSEPRGYPGQFSRRDFKAVLGIPRGQGVWFINGYVFAPNEVGQQKAKQAYRPWDWQKAKDMAEATASAYGDWPISFHTHPGASPVPSPADYAFAGIWCKETADMAVFTIASPSPLRLRPYVVRWGNPSAPGAGRVTSGLWLSWRGAAMRELRDALKRRG
jgi:proteasome lid subunit RPN8/RPN11